MSPNIEQVIVGLGTGLVVLAIGLLVKRISRLAAVFAAVGLGMIALVLWPRAVLVEVPDLSNLSRDEAALNLNSLNLVGVPQPQEAPNTPPEHVVPSSQTPLPGTKVQRGTLVRFSVSTSTSIDAGTVKIGRESSVGQVSIFSPKDGRTVEPGRGADNVFRFEVEGTMAGFDSKKSALLLWVQPINPPSDQPGWYLQRLPNGIVSITGKSWRGRCQLGYQQFPPHEGDIVEVAVSIVSAQEAMRLNARQGPLTTVVLPGVVSHTARVKIHLK